MTTYRVSYRIVSYRIVSYRIVSQRSAAQRSVAQRCAAQRSAVQRSAEQRSTEQRSGNRAVPSSALSSVFIVLLGCVCFFVVVFVFCSRFRVSKNMPEPARSGAIGERQTACRAVLASRRCPPLQRVGAVRAVQCEDMLYRFVLIVCLSVS